MSTHQSWFWERNRRMILLLIYSGLRLDEARMLLWKDVNVTQRTIRVRCGKGGKSRTIPLHRKLAEEFTQLERRPECAVIPTSPDGAGHSRTPEGCPTSLIAG